MSENYVVELSTLIDRERIDEVAEQVAAELDIPTSTILQLLSKRLGPITKPIARHKAERLAGLLRKAGAEAVIVEVGSEANPPLSSTRWLPSPHKRYTPEDLRAPPGESISELRKSPDHTAQRPLLGQKTGAWEPVIGFAGTAERFRIRRRRLVMAAALALAVMVLLLLHVPARSSAVMGRAIESEPAGTYQLGLEYYRRGDFRAARKRWLLLAEAGHARAQYMLGYMSESGQGQPWSNARAARWYRLAAEQGLAEAQLELGALYQRGMGVPQSDVEAVRWYRLAAEQGYEQAELRLATMLFYGIGTPQDFAEALEWFQRAAQHGSREASAYLSFVAWRGGFQASLP